MSKELNIAIIVLIIIILLGYDIIAVLILMGGLLIGDRISGGGLFGSKPVHLNKTLLLDGYDINPPNDLEIIRDEETKNKSTWKWIDDGYVNLIVDGSKPNKYIEKREAYMTWFLENEVVYGQQTTGYKKERSPVLIDSTKFDYIISNNATKDYSNMLKPGGKLLIVDGKYTSSGLKLLKDLTKENIQILEKQ